jgi:5-methyltetrahydrofolate--homocysteine methyltransferase
VHHQLGELRGRGGEVRRDLPAREDLQRGLVIGTIDEDPEAAMARTADRKVSIATRAIERAQSKHGLDVADIFIDPLVLPISTGMDSDRRSALGAGRGHAADRGEVPRGADHLRAEQCEFGLKPAARVVLNSVLLHELVKNGMTSAIVHASKILPLNKIDDEHKQAALDLIYDRRAESNGGTGLPEGVTTSRSTRWGGSSSSSRTSRASRGRRRRRRTSRSRSGCGRTSSTARRRGCTSASTRRWRSTPARHRQRAPARRDEDRGRALRLGADAAAVRAAVGRGDEEGGRPPRAAHGEVEGQTKGTIVLATVKGDVHDIGKNLVDIILTNNGYTVHNIGIKQTIDEIIAPTRSTSPTRSGCRACW